MVVSSPATETFDMKLAASPREQPETCTSSRDGKAFCKDQASPSHHTASTSALNQGPILRGNGSGFKWTHTPSQHGASTSTGQKFASASNVSKRRDGDEPIHQVSSSALLATDSLCCEKKSWQKEEDREKQQAKLCNRLRYVPNWSYALQRSLPPTELPRCHDNAKDWPALGNNESQTEEVQRRCNETSVFRAKPRFRAFNVRSSHPRYEDLRQDSVREGNATRGNKTVTEEVRGEAKLMMLNRDFTVTSPVRENLLVTIALTSQRSIKGEEEEEELERAVKEPNLKPVRVLIGKFTAFSSFLQFKLCRDALRVKFEQNAGGSSTISESLSVEYFARRFQAQDVVTEMEVEYWSSNWKKVDYICTLYGQRVGVSVTRAMCYPDPNAFSTDIAYRLLYKKLYGLVVARDGVSKRHSFSNCILHVWCETQRTAEIMNSMYAGVRKDLEISDDVIMVLTVADGQLARPIFYEHALDNT